MDTNETTQSAKQAESLTDIIGYLIVNPDSSDENTDGEVNVITAYKPQVASITFISILEDLHNGISLLLDRKTVEEVWRRIEALDPLDSWGFFKLEAADNWEEIELISPDETIASMISKKAITTEDEIRVVTAYREWEDA